MSHHHRDLVVFAAGALSAVGVGALVYLVHQLSRKPNISSPSNPTHVMHVIERDGQLIMEYKDPMTTIKNALADLNNKTSVPAKEEVVVASQPAQPVQAAPAQTVTTTTQN
eukprot:TRINITY_DN1630_c0_g1_i2.p1 TRINITY_DN1630_c0_g1~~TRINITY_DN1630_c0_g1_i2.p1  ORF type:complete len:111 (+),score=36.29 TRINITY_DN1630_c0_g1_i2:398-730(+)